MQCSKFQLDSEGGGMRGGGEGEKGKGVEVDES